MASEPFPYACAWEAQLPRTLMLAARAESPAQDLLDCAALLASSGRTEAAALLSDLAQWRGGGSWTADPPGGEAKHVGSTWDAAVGELGELIAIAEDGAPLPDAPEILRRALSENELEAPTPPVLPSVRLAAVGTRLTVALGTLLDLRESAASLVEEAFLQGAIDLDWVQSDPSGLATAVTFNTVRRELVRRGELARSPYGSPALFRSAERLTASGLGAGLANVAVLAPTWPELELLIEEAWRGAPRQRPRPEAVARFGVLLSIGLPPPAMRILMDELADAGQEPILIGLLVRLLREPLDLVDHNLLRTLRDAFLDLGRLPLAVAAQRRLTLASGRFAAETAAQLELEAGLRREHPDGRPREIVRRSGFGSTAVQRRRRFQRSAERAAVAADPLAL